MCDRLEQLGRNLRKARGDMLAYRLSDAVGITDVYRRYLERGERAPSLECLERWAKVCDTSVSAMLRGCDELFDWKPGDEEREEDGVSDD